MPLLRLVWTVGDFERFVGKIAMMFVNTATIESGFSILACEKDEYRLFLTDLLLEDIDVNSCLS